MTMKISLRTCLRLCVVVASVLSGASAQADLKVGVLISLTGYGAALGAPARNAVELLPKTLGGQKVSTSLPTIRAIRRLPCARHDASSKSCTSMPS